MSGPKIVHEYFPEPLIALREEIDKHPDLMVLLALQQDKDVYVQICEIAAYCEVLVDGTYTRDDMIQLCEMLVQKLMQKRTINIFTPPMIH